MTIYSLFTAWLNLKSDEAYDESAEKSRYARCLVTWKMVVDLPLTYISYVTNAALSMRLQLGSSWDYCLCGQLETYRDVILSAQYHVSTRSFLFISITLRNVFSIAILATDVANKFRIYLKIYLQEKHDLGYFAKYLPSQGLRCIKFLPSQDLHHTVSETNLPFICPDSVNSKQFD